MREIAVVGGTGIGELLGVWPGRSICVTTERGVMRGRRVERDGLKLICLQRHAFGHKLPPHAVPYAAMALGLKQLGVEWCLSTAAVGSLRTDWPVGTLAACEGFVDVSGRNLTLHDRIVRHVDMGEVFAAASALASKPEIKTGAVYLNVNGPRYETHAEIRSYQKLADVVGMTAGSEATMMREAGIGYGCLAIVTNLAAGLAPEQLHHGEVTDVMKTKGEHVLTLLLRAAKILSEK